MVGASGKERYRMTCACEKIWDAWGFLDMYRVPQ